MKLVEKARDRLRLRDFDMLTPESRSRERYKRIGLTAIASMGATGISLAVTVLSLPLTLHYLGAEQFGLWVTITSVTALLGFANLGLSNGLVNGVSEALGRNDQETASRYVSSAFYILSGITVLLGIVFAISYPFVPWPEVFNVASPAAAAVTGPAVAVLLTVTLIGLPLGVVPGIRAGLQEGFATSAWQAVGSVVSLLGLLTAMYVEADLPWLVLALGGAPVVASSLNGIALFRRRPQLIPRLNRATRNAAKHMMRLGLLFFILSIAGAVAYQTDNIVIAQLLGPEDVAQYAIPMRLFMIAPLFLSFALIPLWPAYGEAFARGDHVWIRRTFARSLAISATLGALLSAALLAFAVPILHAWVGNEINPSRSLLVALSVWALLNCLTGPIAMYLNAANVLGFQVACATTMMIANLAFSIALTHAIGISGPAWGSVIAQVVFVLFPSALYMRSRLRRLQPRLLSAERGLR
jgi:O-antigen/teichoic acid export membrane protein